MSAEPYLSPGNIGGLRLRNRLIRAATSESMASDSGAVTAELIGFYRTLARGGAGLLITGHMYVEQRGRYNVKQTAICSDEHVPGLKQLAQAVHGEGGVIFAELAHAGSQSLVEEQNSVAPSYVPNAMWNRRSREMTAEDIETTLAAFGAAARRALEAGFDGIHLHGGNGYLISQFASPVSNRRTDGWGGDSERRWRFLVAVYERVRQSIGRDVPVTARIGIADGVAGGIAASEGIAAVSALRARGLDAVEPTLGLMATYLQNVRPYVGIGWARAVQSIIVPRLWTRAAPEAYYRPFAREIKMASDIPVILVGGIRSTEAMADILHACEADFLALARPLIREPDLPNQLTQGRKGQVDCVSCNICLSYDGRRSLQCWRSDPIRLARHAWHRIAGIRT